MTRELPGPGEVIEVCQQCGAVIEVREVTAPWGDRYRIAVCTAYHPPESGFLSAYGSAFDSDYRPFRLSTMTAYRAIPARSFAASLRIA
jgi:hypothetical protein